MSQASITKQSRYSSPLLLVMGVLWLLFAAGHLFYQLANPTVEVKWETATELQTAGFHLYRSTSPDGAFVPITSKTGLIPSKGNALTGAAYSFIDDDVEVGRTYYYKLEEVEYDLSTNFYEDDIQAYQVPYATAWTIILTAISLLIGLAMLVTGLKEDKSI